ncbi:DNA invertase Pin-like site-specific DNA recombinase [Nitrospirillum iridis]|uniref:DNA invertase Pin-like site-specific DNA recombinase n=1 Tax=Nitrospirillum iridis TaxID=765888 RepID=A0A7X0B5J7_9PROT|nr:DNA invertase Pin-like site-specific DNA recombinase [Nitrospirillum iridis]
MTVPLRAALYLRVSTARQAEHDISIPDQKRQGEAYCQSRGYQLIETYVEPGASATNDRRPEFQRMIEAGTSKPAPFDMVIVHSFSRFFRDHFELEFYVRKLAKSGVKLLSITQEMGDDPMHVMMRQIMALFDEYQSKENAKHVIRALKENARQGFWNGSLPPIGYRVVAAEQRGAKVKKKLEIDPLHAGTVRLIYRLALHGDGDHGQMGVKNIVSHLNRNRIFTRDGGRWGIGQVHRILTRRTYMGEHEFNKRAKSKELKPVSEIVVVPVPPLIDRETFEAVQALLQGPPSHGDAIRRHQWSDHAHRPDPLRQVRRRHDHPHRQGRALSLLRLFDESPAGTDSLRGYGGADGQAGRSCRQPSRRPSAPARKAGDDPRHGPRPAAGAIRAPA